MPEMKEMHPQLLDAIVHRAVFDRGFREALLSAPRETIQGAFGVTFPESFALRFIEKDPSLDLLVVLPDMRDSDEELSDDDLEAVAGGGDGDWAPPPPNP